VSSDEQKKPSSKAFYLIFTFAVNLVFYFLVRAEGSYELREFTFGVMLTCWPFSYFAAVIANYLRKALMPDLIITDEGFTGLFKAQVFWLIGPQFFAACIPPLIGLMMVADLGF
jgi:hypothetical protein